MNYSTGWQAAGSGGRFWNGSFGYKTPAPIQDNTNDYKSQGDNSSPIGRTVPVGIGVVMHQGEIIVDPKHVGGYRVSGDKTLVNIVFCILDTQLGGTFQLIWARANKEIIIRKQAPVRGINSQYRFYGGNQTTVDPLITRYLPAADRTAWPGFCYIVFEDFDIAPYDNKIPIFDFHVASSVTAISVDTEISSLTFGALPTGGGAGSNPDFGIDRIRNTAVFLYHLSGPADAWAVVTDLTTMTEVSRAEMFFGPGVVGFTGGAGRGRWNIVLEGTDYCVNCHLTTSLFVSPAIALMNYYSGEVIAALTPSATNLFQSPQKAIRIGNTSRFLVLGDYSNDTNFALLSNVAFWGAIVDTSAETIELIFDSFIDPARTGDGTRRVWSIAVSESEGSSGDPSSNSVGFFWTERTDGGTEAPADGVWRGDLVGETLTVTKVYTAPSAAKNPEGVWYDSTDGTIVILHFDATISKINSSGVVSYNVASGLTSQSYLQFYVNRVMYGGFGDSKYTSDRPGYGYIAAYDGNDGLYEVDFKTGSISLVSGGLVGGDFIDASFYWNQYGGGRYEPVTSVGATSAQVYRYIGGDATPSQVDLADILLQLSTFDSRHVVGDLEFSGFLGNECYGLKFETDTSIQDGLRSLREPFDLSIVESDGKLKFIYPPRDGSFVIDATLTEIDFVDKGSHVIEKIIADESEAIFECTISFLDRDNYGEKGEATFTRPVGVFDLTKSINRRTINLPLYMTASQALALATMVVYRSVYALETYQFSLGPGKAFMEPGNIVQFAFEDFTIVAQIKDAQLNADYSQDISAYQYLQANDATYNGSTVTLPTTTANVIATRLIFLDVPLLVYSHDLDGEGFVQYAQIAAYGTQGVSGSLYKSADDSEYDAVGARSGIEPVTGLVTSISGVPADPFVKDETNEIEIIINSGDIDSVVSITEAELENGVNLAAVGANGRWVLLLFQTVAISNGRITLSDLYWGARGSEVWIDDLAVGDQFIILKSTDYIRYNVIADAPGDTFYYRIANNSYPVASALTHTRLSTGVAETPYASRNLEASFYDGGVRFDWDYRSRVAAGLNPTNHGEATLSFQVDIMDGDSPNTVVRTISVSTNQADWTDAQIASDFGTLPTSWVWRVYMMSALPIVVSGQSAGRGYRAQQTSTVVTGAILTEGDEQSGTDQILLEGDEQSGTDAESFREITNG